MTEQTQYSAQGRNNQMKIGLAVVGLVVIAAIGYMMFRNRSADTNVLAPASSPTTLTEEGTSPITETSEMTADQAYIDGTYTAVGNYTSPGGQEEVGVTLTLENGIVTESEVEVRATRPISVERQNDFAANYQEMVVGKNIADLQLGKVSGSSLTPQGFNDAVEKIKADAAS